MKKILIDVDDVICDWAFLTTLNNLLNTNYTYDDIKEYFIDSMIEDNEKRNEFFELVAKTDIYQHAKFMPDALEVLKELNKFYEIYICSACVLPYRKRESGMFFYHKFNYIVRELPFIDPYKIIFTNSKNLFVADYQIDDRIENMQNKHVKHRLLFDSYHNKDYSDIQLKKMGIKRVKSWQEIAKLLLNREV